MGENGQLLMSVEEGISYDYLTKYEEHKEAVIRLIEDYLGKAVEIEIRPLEENRQFEASYVDLSKLINMEIEEEDN